MKIKNKFIIALVLIVLLPAGFTLALTTNFLSDNFSFIHFFDTYFDIFHNFSQQSEAFSQFIEPYSETPENFKSSSFQSQVAQQFSSSYLTVEITENHQVLFTTYEAELSDAKWVERMLYQWFTTQSPDASVRYALTHHQYVTPSGDIYEIALKVDSTRLEVAYQVFERIFFLFYGIVNLVLLGFLIAWISNPVKHSITKLTHTTNEIRKGNFNVPLDYNDADDFEELAQSVESMRRSLVRSIDHQQRLENEKKELIANISHDLRTPITSIRGYVQGLKDGVARTKEMQQEYLDTIESKTYMIESLVNDLSEITGYDTHAIKLNTQIIDLRRFLFDCVDELEKDVHKYGGKLHLHYIIKDTQIKVDPEKLMRVFINIIENAIKYRSEQPIEIVILANSDDDGVFINISDNGIGVPETDIQQIFERFYRTDKSRNLNIGGSGIGLSICKEIVEAHGGKISAYSNDTSGLTISIRLKSHREALIVEKKDTKHKTWREKYGKNTHH